MARSTPDIADFGLRTGDHVCAFYNDGGNALDDIVVTYVSRGLEAGDKCVCFIDSAPTVRPRIPEALVRRTGILEFRTPDDAYLPAGEFSKDAHIRKMELMAQEALAEGYEHFRLLGDATFVVRNALDTKTWFAYESEVNEFAPRYPQFLMCLYNLDQFDGDMVIYVLQTHPRIFVNGMILSNPYYIPTRQFLDQL